MEAVILIGHAAPDWMRVAGERSLQRSHPQVSLAPRRARGSVWGSASFDAIRRLR